MTTSPNIHHDWNFVMLYGRLHAFSFRVYRDEYVSYHMSICHSFPTLSCVALRSVYQTDSMLVPKSNSSKCKLADPRNASLYAQNDRSPIKRQGRVEPV